MKPRETKVLSDWLTEATERIERMQPIIKTKWYAVEVTPSKPYYDDYNYGPNYTEAKARVCSNYYGTKEEVEAFLEKFEPDEGSHFEIRKKNLRQFTRWVGITDEQRQN